MGLGCTYRGSMWFKGGVMSSIYIWKGVASIAACVLGSYCMYITKGTTGIGWAIFGIFIIWAWGV